MKTCDSYLVTVTGQDLQAQVPMQEHEDKAQNEFRKSVAARMPMLLTTTAS